MSEQLNLFEAEESSWVQAVWKSVGGPTRSQVIAALAQMAKAALRGKGALATILREEGRDASGSD